MNLSNYYLSDNRLERLFSSLFYLHDDIFLKDSKEFITSTL